MVRVLPPTYARVKLCRSTLSQRFSDANLMRSFTVSMCIAGILLAIFQGKVGAQEVYPWSAQGGTAIRLMDHAAGTGNTRETACSKASPVELDPVTGIEDEAPVYVDAHTDRVGLGSKKHPITPAIYDDIRAANSSTYLVKKDGCLGLLGSKGQELIPFQFNAIGVSDYADHSGDATQSMTVVLEAGRPDGRFLYRIDTVRGLVVKTLGPLGSIVKTEDYEVPGYAVVSDKEGGSVGLVDQNLNYILPPKYQAIRGLPFSSGQAAWIGITDHKPFTASANSGIRTLYTMDLFTKAGALVKTLHAYALWDLPSMPDSRYGFVALQEDHSCLYVGDDLQSFETGQSNKDRCPVTDRWHRVFITRPQNNDKVIWALTPPDPVQLARLPVPSRGKEAQSLWTAGKYRWNKTYEGAFSVVDSTEGDEFVLTRLSDSRGPDTQSFKVIDGNGHDTGGVYDDAKFVCGRLYVRRDGHLYVTQSNGFPFDYMEGKIVPGGEPGFCAGL